MLGCTAVVHLAWNTREDNYRSGYTDPNNLMMAAYSPGIRMDLAVALENLSVVKYDVENPDVPYDRSEHAQILLDEYPILRHLDFKTMKETFGLFDGFDIIRQSSA